MGRITTKLAFLAAQLDAQGEHDEADVITSILQRVASRRVESASSLETHKDRLSEEFLGLYTIHGIAASQAKEQITVYADDLSLIPAEEKAKMKKMAAPFPVVFKASEEPDAEKALRLDKKI